MLAAIFSLDMPAYPLPGGWFFNPFSWQLIFVLGLTCGFRRIRFGTATTYSPWLMGLALAYAFVAFLTIRFSLWSWWGDLGLPTMIAGFDKTYVSLPRLLHLVAILYIFSNPAKTSVFASISRDNLFAMVGRHSLPVFAVGTVLSLFGQVVKFGGEPSLVFDSLLILGGAVDPDRARALSRLVGGLQQDPGRSGGRPCRQRPRDAAHAARRPRQRTDGVIQIAVAGT